MTPAEMHTAATAMRYGGPAATATLADPDFRHLIADWLDQCASSWALLIRAADEVIDTTDPKQAEAGHRLRLGPYDAKTARDVARMLLVTEAAE